MKQYEFHPISEIFPLLEGKEFEDFCGDLEANGLHEPIVLYQGKILDGRNRYRGCVARKLKARFEKFTGKDPIAFVLSKNLHRRHLDTSQRAMVGARIATLDQGEKESNGRDLSDRQGCRSGQISQGKAAKVMNVSERMVRDARKVQEEAVPEISEQVEAGNLTVTAAAEAADLPANEQQAVARVAEMDGKKAAAQAVKHAKSSNGEAEPEKTDGLGESIPPGLVPVFDKVPVFKETVNSLNKIAKTLKDLASCPAGACLLLQQAELDLRNLKETVKFSAPYAVCPMCKGIAKSRKANCACKNRGWLRKNDYDNLPQEYRQ